MTSLVKKKDGILAEPLVKPQRDKPSLYRQARRDLDKKFKRKSVRRKK